MARPGTSRSAESLKRLVASWGGTAIGLTGAAMLLFKLTL